MRSDPDYFDVKIAGWWVWGLCSWIGSGWCRAEAAQLPHMGNAGQGINRKLPHMGNAGQGINRKLPHMGDAGQGINRKLPHMGNAGQGIHDYFQSLSQRLRKVRVACGDWTRVLGASVTEKHGMSGIFLDPPYGGGRCDCYSVENTEIHVAVREWAVANGENPLLKIAICGYDGELEMPGHWHCVKWKAIGGYGSQGNGRGRENANRETIWFSPSCCATPLFADQMFAK